MQTLPPPATTDCVPQDIRARLTHEQVTRLAALMGAREPNHKVAYRASTNLFGRPMYLALFTGHEARGAQRIHREGLAVSGVGMLVRVVMVCGWVTVSALVLAIAGIVIAYLIKSWLGIDLMDGPSFLHRFFFD